MNFINHSDLIKAHWILDDSFVPPVYRNINKYGVHFSIYKKEYRQWVLKIEDTDKNSYGEIIVFLKGFLDYKMESSISC